MLAKEQIIFDPTEAIGSCDEIGSYIISKSGDVIDSTDVSGTDGLNVNVLNDLTCDLDGVYDVSTNPNPDNVGNIYHDRNATPGDTHQTFRSTGAQPNSSTVDPAIVYGIDVNAFMLGYDSANDEFERLESDNGILKIEVTNASLDTNATIQGYGSCAHSAKSVTTVVTQLVASALTGRKSILVQNLGTKPIFLGCDNTVSTATGVKIPKGASYEFSWDATVDLHAITATGTADVRLLEAA